MKKLQFKISIHAPSQKVYDVMLGISNTVDLDTAEDFLDYMNQTYPKALGKLKEICED
jgi:hypothetical protein